jgi:hypothetical protein
MLLTLRELDSILKGFARVSKKCFFLNTLPSIYLLFLNSEGDNPVYFLKLLLK